jgi:cytochrome c553
MHQVHSFYQTLLPVFALPWRGITYIKDFFDNLFIRKGNKKLYARISLAILITIPFLVVFVSLLFSADEHFKKVLTDIFSFELNLQVEYFLTVPLYFLLYLLLFIYSSSNHKDRTKIVKIQSLDMLIIGIFLGLINLLFLMFIATQLPFVLGEPNLPPHTTLAEFAREGFFQLMMVMGIILLIFLFIMRRFKGEKVATTLLSGLLVQTIIMGVVSLKKMYLYQSIKGATVMRYYVEWFDYFLLIIFGLGLLFLVRKLPFTKLLNLVAILALFSFGLIISLNVDGMVASHNIEKFKKTPKELDRYAIAQLSIDALPAIQGTDIVIRTYQTRRDCSKISDYHLGYCSKITKYGKNQYTVLREDEPSVYSDNYRIQNYKGMKAPEIYKTCAGCHGLTGEQKALGKSSIIQGQEINKTINQLQSYKTGTLNLYGMGGLMKGQVAGLDEENIKTLAIYIFEMKKGENRVNNNP